MDAAEALPSPALLLGHLRCVAAALRAACGSASPKEICRSSHGSDPPGMDSRFADARMAVVKSGVIPRKATLEARALPARRRRRRFPTGPTRVSIPLSEGHRCPIHRAGAGALAGHLVHCEGQAALMPNARSSFPARHRPAPRRPETAPGLGRQRQLDGKFPAGAERAAVGGLSTTSPHDEV